MLWSEHWWRLAKWSERWPLWSQFILFPIAAPPILAVAAACLCPRMALIAVSVLIGVYGLLIRGNVLAWADVGKTLGVFYLMIVASISLGMLELVARRAFDWVSRRWFDSDD